MTLRNGTQIKVTADHRLLTEDGWRPLNELQPGDYVAPPAHLLGPGTGEGQDSDRRKLRILAYLIADGSLTSGTMVDFVSKDPAMLAEYERCLAVFNDVAPTYVTQVREVTRIGAAKSRDSGLDYHSPNGLLVWLENWAEIPILRQNRWRPQSRSFIPNSLSGFLSLTSLFRRFALGRRRLYGQQALSLQDDLSSTGRGCSIALAAQRDWLDHSCQLLHSTTRRQCQPKAAKLPGDRL